MRLLEILAQYGFDTAAKAKMARHQDNDPALDFEALKSSVQFEDYQCWQANPVFHNAEYVVSFTGDGGQRARFWGVYRVLGHRLVSTEKLPQDVPWRWKDQEAYHFYKLQKLPHFEPLKNQLVIAWSSEHRWDQNLKDNEVLNCSSMPSELQEMTAVIVKIQFGSKSGVYAETYLDEMECGEWTRWNTPRKYKELQGDHRKLLLYDKSRNGITVG
jgi:hypothetical protein